MLTPPTPEHDDQYGDQLKPAPLPMAVHAALHRIEQRWDQLRLPQALRARLLSDLEADLHAAYLDGVTPHALLGTDEIAFADEVAAQLGYDTRQPPPPPVVWPPALPQAIQWRAGPRDAPARRAHDASSAGYGRLLLAAGLAGAACVLLGLVVVFPVGRWLYDLGLGGAGPLLTYAAFVGVFTTVVLVAVHRSLHGLGRARETVTRAAVLMPCSAVISLPLAVYVGWVSGYSWRPAVLIAEIGLVLGLAALSLLAARSWALREPPRPVATAAGAR